ncbi:hypothetical protein CspeluHIS016_0208410 [Cutaneotrichosporon spelunceum]|uniref:NADH:flavin oxidoreductase/NADH oxidase N-terminal domain-containing protein n=1 Tax=Cutaneotrichosporon spelunceum TaxID=1672016 RepID=A0AAD3TS15_9TREE|nr:hypothetical protein CspeluHIS016_0208410 [Cutaneotrichosporon spelunceum]
MVSSSQLFAPVRIGAAELKHRVVLAPLTRMRSDYKTAVPPDLAIEYYGQRASEGGLLVSEGVFIAAEAGGMAGVPGIWSEEQVAKWRQVTDAVHAKGGVIFAQLWALGRVANPELVPTVWGPSDDPYVANPKKPVPVKVTAMGEAEIDRWVAHYVSAAKNAIKAGFDGVEIHGANGYIVDQFLQSITNKRTDKYGGSIENRLRFPLRVLNGVCDAIGAEHVGIRMSPFGIVQGMRETVPLDTFIPWTKAIIAAQPRLAYIHAVTPRTYGVTDMPEDMVVKSDDLQPIRNLANQAGISFISAGAYKPAGAIETADKHGDLIAFGRYFIANPDLPARIAQGWELNHYDRSTFYTRGAKGYVDYPEYKGASAHL